MVMTDADLARIRTAIGEVARATKRRDDLVRRLRDKGATWTEVGFALGVTAQAAQQKYGSGDERSAAHREKAAKNAIKKARAAARKAAASGTTPEGRGKPSGR